MNDEFKTATSLDGKEGYDQVYVPAANGGKRKLSRNEFEALPLRERVAYLVEGRAEFFLEGRPIAPHSAMKG